MFRKLYLSTLFLFSAFTLFSQSDTGETIHAKVIKVSNNIYMLQGYGGNIGLSFGNDGIFMIDTGVMQASKQIQKEIKKLSNKAADSITVQFLVNTHFHEDHVGGNIEMAKTGTIIFSQDNTRKRLEGMIKKGKRKIPETLLPRITFTDSLTFHYNSDDIHIFHVPAAHTDGDAMVYFSKSNMLHMGDVFFNGKYPFIDIENGGSYKGVITAMEKILSEINDSTKIIPGHGDLATSKDLQATINMLTSIYKQVATQYVSGKTENEVATMKDITKEFDAKGYGDGFITTEAFLRMTYKEVGAARGDIESNAEKNRKAREKVKQMEKEYNQKKNANKKSGK